jgi:hypothetical protein
VSRGRRAGSFIFGDKWEQSRDESAIAPESACVPIRSKTKIFAVQGLAESPIAAAGLRTPFPPLFKTEEGIAPLTHPGFSDLFRHIRRGKRPAFARQTRPIPVSEPRRTVHPSDNPACRPVYHRLLYQFMQNYVEDYHARHYETVKA